MGVLLGVSEINEIGEFVGEIGEFTGISAPYEAPSKPDLHLRTDQMTPEESAQKILEFLREGGKLH